MVKNFQFPPFRQGARHAGLAGREGLVRQKWQGRLARIKVGNRAGNKILPTFVLLQCLNSRFVFHPSSSSISASVRFRLRANARLVASFSAENRWNFLHDCAHFISPLCLEANPLWHNYCVSKTIN